MSDNKNLWMVPTIAGVVALLAGAPSWAGSLSLTADGVTYTLNETTLSPTEDQFQLVITGINGGSDTEGGRYGVNSLAFTDPGPGDVTTGSLSGFAFMTGGLNAMGCDGSGNFYCFKANTKPTAPALAANSSLTLTFDVTVAAAGELNNYDPALKIQWLGTNKNYDLVSQQLAPVPLPAAFGLLLSGVGGLGFFARRRITT